MIVFQAKLVNVKKFVEMAKTSENGKMNVMMETPKMGMAVPTNAELKKVFNVQEEVKTVKIFAQEYLQV